MADNYITCSGENGSICISADVISVIVASSIAEVEGVASHGNTVGSELAEFLGKKGSAKGVKVSVEEEKVVVDAFIMVCYGYAVTTVARNAQAAVVNAVESMTGMGAPVVNVHVSGVAFEKQ